LVVLGKRIERCPWSAESEIWKIINWWVWWKELEILPFRWGVDLDDEPAFVAEAFRICEQVRREEEASMAKKEQAGRGAGK